MQHCPRQAIHELTSEKFRAGTFAYSNHAGFHLGGSRSLITGHWIPESLDWQIAIIFHKLVSYRFPLYGIGNKSPVQYAIFSTEI